MLILFPALSNEQLRPGPAQQHLAQRDVTSYVAPMLFGRKVTPRKTAGLGAMDGTHLRLLHYRLYADDISWAEGAVSVTGVAQSPLVQRRTESEGWCTVRDSVCTERV